MLVVTILLVLFLAVLNIVNIGLSRKDSQSVLNRIMDRSTGQNPAMAGSGAPGMPGPEGDERARKDAEGDIYGSYFTAHVNENGAVTSIDSSHADDLTWDNIVALLQDADAAFGVEVTGETEADLSERPDVEQREPDSKVREPAADDGRRITDKKTVTGKTGSYIYKAEQLDDGSVMYAFLDVSLETSFILRLLLITGALGIGTWLLVFLLVIYLSRRAIAPIALNIEKQRQFITDAGHELKTPLAVIISNVDVQELHSGKTKWLDNIRSQALRLSDLTKQMLTLSKMDESGKNSFISTTFDASQMLEDTVRIFRESASLRGIEIRTQIDPGIQITFSREQFQQMLELLMDNAVKYGKENGEILVSLQTQRRLVRMKFSNSCEELPDIDPDRLFDRFYRADTSRSRQTGGSGIGLAVVRAIAEHNGGKASAHFCPDNVIEFVIEIPENKKQKV